MPELDTNSQPINIQDANRLISTVVTQAVVRPTGTMSDKNQGASGFIFDIIDKEKVQFESVITDHYIEDNTPIQDHIALRPERFAVRGFVGELNDILVQGLQAIISGISRLAIVDSIAPGFTNQANQVYSTIQEAAGRVSSVVTQVQNAYGLFTQKNTTATKQQNAFNYFKSMWQSKQTFQVETPFGIFQDMVIEALDAEQSGESRFVSSFQITFKKVRILRGTIQLLSSSLEVREAGRAINLFSTQVDQGLAQGKESPFADIQVAFGGVEG